MVKIAYLDGLVLDHTAGKPPDSATEPGGANLSFLS